MDCSQPIGDCSLIETLQKPLHFHPTVSNTDEINQLIPL